MLQHAAEARDGALEHLLLVTKALLALDLSAHPDSFALPGIPTKPVMGLGEFMDSCGTGDYAASALVSADSLSIM